MHASVVVIIRPPCNETYRHPFAQVVTSIEQAFMPQPTSAIKLSAKSQETWSLQHSASKENIDPASSDSTGSRFARLDMQSLKAEPGDVTNATVSLGKPSVLGNSTPDQEDPLEDDVFDLRPSSELHAASSRSQPGLDSLPPTTLAHINAPPADLPDHPPSELGAASAGKDRMQTGCACCPPRSLYWCDANTWSAR